jgi:hypothetical protein
LLEREKRTRNEEQGTRNDNQGTRNEEQGMMILATKAVRRKVSRKFFVM